jgi:MFS transporter, PHS family, inorganic phosphate transporter
MIIIVATFGQALSGQGSGVTFIGVMVVWRFIVSLPALRALIHAHVFSQMGVGIGGDYPLSAVISSEFASTKIRGRMMTAVFASQGWGNFAAALVALIVTAAYKNGIQGDSIENGFAHIDYVWRLLIGLGCVPAVVALYFRLTITETPRYTMDVENDVARAHNDVAKEITHKENGLEIETVRAEIPKASWADFCHHFSQWKNLKILLGTSYSWFALDVSNAFIPCATFLLTRCSGCFLRSRIELLHCPHSNRFRKQHYCLR